MIINATQHVVNFKSGDKMLVFPPSGVEARISTKAEPIIDGDPHLVHVTTGDLTGLPPFRDGVFYIVSSLVQGAAPDREDLIVPFEQVREAGNPVYCLKFSVPQSATAGTKYLLRASLDALLSGEDTPEAQLARFREQSANTQSA